MSVSPPASTEPGAEAVQSQWFYNSTGVRVLQACHSCGKRPTCSACVLRRLSCTWPSTPETGGIYNQAQAQARAPNDNVVAGEEARPKRRRLSRARRDEGGGGDPPVALLRRALDIFRERHFGVEFCSFLHLPSVDVGLLRQRSPFFAHALIALSALYMTQQEAADQGFARPETLSEWHTTVAREYSRQSVDAPSVSSIQANLILALRELLARTLYKAWIFAGIAIRQAQALRLGLEYHGRLPNRQKEVQRRTYWAAFVMDRMVSHCCWRPQMIDSDCVRLNLPCPETPFLLQESFSAPNLETLEFPCAVSRLGLAPYFITILHLWSQATYSHVKGGRRYSRSGPDDPQGFFNQHEKKIDDIHGSLLSVPMRWSAHNWRLFRHMNQSALFVNIHLLVNHARCVMHQEYLPYRDSPESTSRHASLQDCGCEREACSQCRQERIISRCLSSSDAILDVMSDLSCANDDDGRQDLQSVFAAGAMLSAANIQLWAHYIAGKDEERRKGALARVKEVAAVFQSWKAQWPVADAWISTLESLRRLYQATYAPDLGFQENPREGQTADSNTSAPPALNESDAYERPYPRLTEGNGLPELDETMSDKIRFILLASLEDTDARERVLSSSISTHVENPRDYDRFTDDLGFDFDSFYTDEIWPGFDTGYTDTSIIH
ncbi:Fc.00g046370.m01.CDS01 [Cosmosporella sp. VM-42]